MASKKRPPPTQHELEEPNRHAYQAGVAAERKRVVAYIRGESFSCAGLDENMSRLADEIFDGKHDRARSEGGDNA